MKCTQHPRAASAERTTVSLRGGPALKPGCGAYHALVGSAAIRQVGGYRAFSRSCDSPNSWLAEAEFVLGSCDSVWPRAMARRGRGCPPSSASCCRVPHRAGMYIDLSSMTSRVRIGAETTPLLRKSAALGRKIRIRCGSQPGYAAVTDATDVPEAAPGAARRGGRHGDIGLTCRARRTGCTRPPVAPNRCRTSCWRSGLLPCVRSNFPEQSGLFPEQ